jgi:radical SAM protein with 4Fe4S-binding SPASM domain
MLSLCDQLGELKCERLTLLGGEPLIHPYWPQVTRRLQNNDVRVNVITNGWTLPDPALCDAIAENGLTIAGISIDGMKESHDKLRREGSFERISIGMDLLRERNIPIAVGTVITSDSIRDLEALYGFLAEKGVSVWQLQIASPLGRLKKDDPLLIKPVQIKQIYDILYAKRELRQMHIDLADDIGYYCSWDGGHIRNTRKHITTWSGCHAGIEVLGIDSNGDIKGCQSLPSTPEFIEGNIRQKTLKEIWNNPEGFSYTRNFKPSQLDGFCSDCRYGNLCKGGCSSSALGYSGKIGDNPMCAYRFEMEKK